MIEVINDYGADAVLVMFITFLVVGFAIWNAICRIRDRYFPSDKSIPTRVNEVEKQLAILKTNDKTQMLCNITTLHSVYMARGYIEEHELSIIEEVYECYKNNGGNGHAERLVEELRDLPRTK